MSAQNPNQVVNVLRMLALLFGLAGHPVFGQSDVGTLSVSIRDKASGEVVPAMLCITSLADNTWRKPPDGREPAGYVTNGNIIEGRLKGPEYVAGTETPWYPGDPGPAVLMAGDFPEDPADATRPYTKKKRKRNLWYYGKPAIPFWKDPAAYFVSKPFTITLPSGKWRLSVMRGIEYLPVFEEFTVTPGQKLEHNVQLARWVDMPRQSWYSGDAHVHSPRVAPSQDVYIMTWAQAMDSHMTCVLSYGNVRQMEGAIQARYGKESRYQQGDYWLESGHEDPRESITEQGHMTQLNIQKIVRDLSKYQLYDFVADGVHAQGGLVGYTHLAWSGPFYHRTKPDLHPGWDVHINTIRGKIDFIDILEAAQLGVEHYYDFLNLGVKLTAMASSDNPAAVVGEERTYAYTGPGKFTVDTWYEAVKQGHTFVTNGPMLLLTVDEAIPGDEVKVAKSAKVHIRGEAWAPELIGTPKLLEVVSHGRVIRSVEAGGPKQEKLVVEFDLSAADSQWIAARTSCLNGAVAHTSPVYVIVDGKSFVDRSQVQQLVAKQLKALDFIEKQRLDNPRFTKNWALGVVDQLRLRIEDARTKYLTLRQSQPGAAQGEPLDIQRAKQLYQRVQNGEKLSPEEQEYLDRVRKEVRRRQQQQKEGTRAAGQTGKKQGRNPGTVPPATASTGLIPLTDLGRDKYKGEDGGLYGGGSNEPPAEFLATVTKQLKLIRPLDADGHPAPDGKIVLLSVGMSNTTMEFQTFKRKADKDPKKSPQVLILDGAQGARVASVWARGVEGIPPHIKLSKEAARKIDPWPVVDQRLKDAGVSPNQIQVGWIKHAQARPALEGEFPKHAELLAENTILTLQRLHKRFPNLRVAYLSSRIYAGYATTALNPEPYAYEGAFAMRWIILNQIQGDPRLNFDPKKGPVTAPAVLWGPYLWTDGIKPRQNDRLVWLKDDVVPSDRTHPSESGREKVANLLLDFMQNDPLARCWYLAKQK